MAALLNLLCTLLLGVIISIEARSSLVTDNRIQHPKYQPYLTAYHFRPPKMWINDPNAPMLYKGIYHLFYQYNPNNVSWGPPVWGHSTSTDLVNWTPQPIAIGPQNEANSNGSWSGSATFIRANKPVILFTGVNPLDKQVQDLAEPKNLSDPYLKEWIVKSEPIMAATPENMINGSAFRDPTTAWYLPDGHWRVIVGTRRKNTGVVLLYRSRNFNSWIKAQHPFYSFPNTGMWECPDFFPVYNYKTRVGVETSVVGSSVVHVLKMSLDNRRHDVYTFGRYDLSKDRFIPFDNFLNDSSLRYDYGIFYASKTFYDDAKKRRVLLGWTSESSSVEDDMKKGWSGIHTIPRIVWFGHRQLMQWPVEEIETLRERPVYLPTQIINEGSTVKVDGITAAQADAEILFQIDDLRDLEKFEANWTDPQKLCSDLGATVPGGLGPFGLLTLASENLEEYTAVFFRIFKSQNKLEVLMCTDQSRSSLNPSTNKTTYGAFVNVDPIAKGLSLRTLIDHSVVESFGARGKSVMTARVYPTLAVENKAHLFVFNYGKTRVHLLELTAWSMKKPNIA